MTGVDLELRAEEAERDNLQRMISALEAAHAVSSPASRSSIMLSLMNLQGQLANVEKRIKETEVDEKREKEEAVAVAIEREAEIEAKLNSDEKRTFTSFLKEKFFTKTDFGRLETFYAHTWDRLSEHGKDEMSHRVWEGIRRDEYDFGELPEVVREKETKRAYEILTQRAEAPERSTIPENDQQDFIRAFASGNERDAERVLDRGSFKKSMRLAPESPPEAHHAVDKGKGEERATVNARSTNGVAKAAITKSVAGEADAATDLSQIGLGGIKLAEVENHGPSSDIPSARTVSQTSRGSTRAG